MAVEINSKEYDYSKSGFDDFLSRSIDGNVQANLDVPPALTVQQTNFDQTQTTGSLGDSFQIGNILLDGRKGRISIFDENTNEVVRIGDLGG